MRDQCRQFNFTISNILCCYSILCFGIKHVKTCGRYLKNSEVYKRKRRVFENLPRLLSVFLLLNQLNFFNFRKIFYYLISIYICHQKHLSFSEALVHTIFFILQHSHNISYNVTQLLMLWLYVKRVYITLGSICIM